MKTTRSGRRWAYPGAVLHWLYFTPFRKHADLWVGAVIGLSIAGCAASLSGLVWGIWRFSVKARYRIKGVHSRSPYTGWMRWRHYAGLAFGLTTFTWMLSGRLSLDPWNWRPGTAPTDEQREALSGGPLRLDAITPERMRAGLAGIRASFVPKELAAMQFRSEPHLVAYRPAADGRGAASLAVSALAPERGPFERFSREDLQAAARSAMPENDVTDAVWLQEYDDYYYDRSGALPALRIRYDDPAETWLYIDPGRAEILRKEERLTRLNRWLYHGLHNLDFRFLYYRRPLWDIVPIVLSLGGIFLAVSSAAQGWRRLRRHGRRLTGR